MYIFNPDDSIIIRKLLLQFSGKLNYLFNDQISQFNLLIFMLKIQNNVFGNFWKKRKIILIIIIMYDLDYIHYTGIICQN